MTSGSQINNGSIKKGRENLLITYKYLVLAQVLIIVFMSNLTWFVNFQQKSVSCSYKKKVVEFKFALIPFFLAQLF